MTKRRKWLPYAAVSTGLIVVLVLVIAINSEPLVRWFQIGPQETGQEPGLEQPEARSITWYEALGTALISVFILALVLSHLSLVIVAASSLNKPQAPPITAVAACPRCERGVQPDWQVCPFCGSKLDKGLLNHSANSPSLVPKRDRK